MPSLLLVALRLKLVDFIVQGLDALGGICLQSFDLLLLTKDYGVKVGLVAIHGLESRKVATMLSDVAFVNGVYFGKGGIHGGVHLGIGGLELWRSSMV